MELTTQRNSHEKRKEQVKKQRSYDYTKLRKIIVEKYGSPERFAASVKGISAQGMRARLAGCTEFRLSEIDTIIDILELSGSDVQECFFQETDDSLQKEASALFSVLPRDAKTNLLRFLRKLHGAPQHVNNY